jgi:tRNA threonylcarbamoyladenosine biosynthesis protein TsaB
VRVGLSAVKGLVEAVPVPIAAVSRLEVLAAKAHAPSAALDAHRCEVFLRLAASGKEPAELLAGAAELAAFPAPPGAIALCEDAAARLILAAWPAAQLVLVPAPTAADALRLAAPRVAARSFIDPLALDGHYLRRSDAEIFSRPAAETPVRR